MSLFARMIDGIERLEIGLCRILVVVLIAVVLLQVLARFVFHWEVLWTLEAAIFCFVWTIMLGSSIAVRRGAHYTIDIFPQTYRLIRLTSYAGILLLSLVFAWYGTIFAVSEWKRFSHPSMIRITFFVSAIPVMGITSALFILEKVLQEFRAIKGKG